MKILYISNSITPPVANYLGKKIGPKGGWISSIIAAIKDSSISVAVAALYEGKTLQSFELDGVLYYCVPCSDIMKYDHKLQDYWKVINKGFEPDVVHIFGTEFPMTLSYIKACGVDNVLVSIQGLVSQIQKYCLGDIPLCERLRSLTIMSVVRKLNMDSVYRSFKNRAKNEIEALNNVKYVEGRTSWDRANVLAINPNIKYYSCNRTLRDSFYTHKKWSYNECEKHSIFVSQGRMPLKGLHKALEALSLVKRHYPDVKLYVTNSLNLSRSNFWGFIYESDYIHYLRKLINKYGLNDNIVTTGMLDEEAMADRMWKSNVFVSASSIENSPNSVAEAQILGVPCIGSYVGGTMDMIKEGETGYLYRFEEVSMLADLICKIFEMKAGVEVMSKQEIICATARHDKSQNIEKMLSIYKEIIETV